MTGRRNWVVWIVRMRRIWSSFGRSHWPFLISLSFKPQKKLLENQAPPFFLFCIISLQKPMHSHYLMIFPCWWLVNFDLQPWSFPKLISNYLLDIPTWKLHLLFKLCIQDWPYVLALARTCQKRVFAYSIIILLLPWICHSGVIFDFLLWMLLYRQLILVLCLMLTCFVWPQGAEPRSVGGSCRETGFASI